MFSLPVLGEHTILWKVDLGYHFIYEKVVTIVK